MSWNEFSHVQAIYISLTSFPDSGVIVCFVQPDWLVLGHLRVIDRDSIWIYIVLLLGTSSTLYRFILRHCLTEYCKHTLILTQSNNRTNQS